MRAFPQRSAERWRLAKKSVAALLGAFDVVLAQDEIIAERFRLAGRARRSGVGQPEGGRAALGGK